MIWSIWQNLEVGCQSFPQTVGKFWLTFGNLDHIQRGAGPRRDAPGREAGGRGRGQRCRDAVPWLGIWLGNSNRSSFGMNIWRAARFGGINAESAIEPNLLADFQYVPVFHYCLHLPSYQSGFLWKIQLVTLNARDFDFFGETFPGYQENYVEFQGLW